MLTVRQIERWWRNGGHDRILTELSTGRLEAAGEVNWLLAGPVAAAALAIVRLDELNQSGHPLASELIRYVIAQQDVSGGWADPATASLCVRALACSRGHGVVIGRGLEFLATVQRPDGLWSRAAGTRFNDGDLHVTAFVAVQLLTAGVRGDVRIEGALAAIDATDRVAEPSLLRLRSHAAHRLPQRANVSTPMLQPPTSRRVQPVPAAA